MLENTADVKELTPEFYCLPDFLMNGAGHEYGARQNGVEVGDVELPPWAHGSAHEFIRVGGRGWRAVCVGEVWGRGGGACVCLYV